MNGAMYYSLSSEGQPLYNGHEFLGNGLVKFKREFCVPYVPDRQCNPIGRLLGCDGACVKQIRQECPETLIVVHSDELYRKQFRDLKITIESRGIPQVAANRMEVAYGKILEIIDQNELTRRMSLFQLMNPNARVGDINWKPTSFLNWAPIVVQTGPTSTELISPLLPPLPAVGPNGHTPSTPAVLAQVNDPNRPSESGFNKTQSQDVRVLNGTVDGNQAKLSGGGKRKMLYETLRNSRPAGKPNGFAPAAWKPNNRDHLNGPWRGQ